MNQLLIEDVLGEVFPDEVELRPDVAAEAARAVANGEPLNFGTSRKGDAFLDPETIDLIYKAALFVAAVVKTIKDGYDLSISIADRAKKSDERLAELSDETAKKLAEATEKKLEKDKN
ncbi:hypothetical protein [Neorhizobium petrolearium]|uniref:hypothetical protein n=1 Tax=Neorhizobium petrolearium TaxID=515361 RepID=UPI003F16E754